METENTTLFFNFLEYIFLCVNCKVYSLFAWGFIVVLSTLGDVGDAKRKINKRQHW